jgi:hypothetical protein
MLGLFRFPEYLMALGAVTLYVLNILKIGMVACFLLCHWGSYCFYRFGMSQKHSIRCPRIFSQEYQDHHTENPWVLEISV